MKSAPLPPETHARLEALELLVQARRFVDQGHPIANVAEAFDLTPEAVQAIPADGALSVEIISNFLGCSHQYVAKICNDSFERIKKFHPHLRQELAVA
jgi:hypothetical protein